MQIVPRLTRNQWLWLGGAAVLGVTEVVSAPIAVALAALPVLDNLASNESSNSRGSTASTSRRTSTASSSSGNGRRRRRAPARRRRTSSTTATE